MLALPFAEIALYGNLGLEKEDPEHHYGASLEEAYGQYIQDNPQNSKEDFFSFVHESTLPKVIYLKTQEEQERNVIHITPQLKTIEHLPKDIPLMFIMDVKGQFYAHEKIRGTALTQGFHHTSFTGAEGVAFAGTIKVGEEGQIEWISDDSGHYRPLSEALCSLLQKLESLGIPLEIIPLNLRRTNHIITAKYWIESYQIQKNPIPGENVLYSRDS